MMTLLDCTAGCSGSKSDAVALRSVRQHMEEGHALNSNCSPAKAVNEHMLLPEAGIAVLHIRGLQSIHEVLVS